MVPEGGPVERLVVMWDYDAFPVWPAGRRSRFAVLPLPIPPALRDDLQAWSDEWTGVMMAALRTALPHADSYVAPAGDVVKAWDERGRVLVQRLRDHLGPAFVVGYHGLTYGEVEWPDRTDPSAAAAVPASGSCGPTSAPCSRGR